MKLGDIANAEALKYGKPLDGVRILAIEQMQALPYGTQLLARLGADVVKVEQPGAGESGRGSLPAMIDPDGQRAGATFLRNNLDKRSITRRPQAPEGPELILALAPHYDVFAENFKGGTMKRLGLGYETIAGGRAPHHLPLGLRLREPGAVAVRRLGRVRADRRSDVGHLRVQVRATSRPSPRRSARSATSRARSSASSACSPRCVTATAPARASTSTSPCSTPSSP